MKIKSIELTNNSFFGNLSIDFVDSSGNIMDNVVIAGENGCGKTQFLNIIYDFFDFSLRKIGGNEVRTFVFCLTPDELNQIQGYLGNNNKLQNPTGVIKITKNFQQADSWNGTQILYESLDSNGNLSWCSIAPYTLLDNADIKKFFKAIFSTVEINYKPKESNNITSNEIDEEVQKSLQSGDNLATEIQQLFIDIQANDANDLQIWVDNNPGVAPPTNITNTRIKRFKNAFSTIFTNLNYSRIATTGNKKKVYFIKGTQDIDISALSSGEKQIVFRGAFLLRNQQSIKGCTVLIDEPEISLHPVWQDKIFEYYRNLFIDSSNQPTSQIFMATHSQYVLKSGLMHCNNTLIILFNHNGSSVNVRKITAPLVLPTVTSAELNYVAFDILSSDYHIELYGNLQNKIAHLNGAPECSVKQCDTYITQQSEYNVATHRKPSSHTTRYGTTNYETLCTYIRNAIDHPDPSRTFSEAELRTSIELLIKLC